MVNSLLRLSFKVWNSAMGVGGFATISYAILMFRAQGETSSPSHHITSVPWFFHAFLFVGIVLCAVTCLGHIAAHTANSCCLSAYIVVILVLLIVQTAIMTGAFLRQSSEKELPLDLSDDFTDSVVSSYYIWKCLSSSVFLIQAICVLLAALSFHITNGVDDHDSEYEDDENAQTRLALLDPSARWQQGERNIV